MKISDQQIIYPLQKMIKTLQINSPRSKTQHILNQREILNVIQICPQIIKEDKLFIRNKVKEIFKDFNFNSNQQYDENKQLLYIFGDCRKPLNKVHLFQNHWHWLQVRLRKYVVNQKKKHKQQCITQFKKERTQQKNKTQNMIKRRFKQDELCSRYDSNLKANRSHENKPQSPRNMIQNTLCQTTRLRNLSGNTSPKYGIPRAGPQTCKNANYFSNENHNWNQFNKVRNNSNNAKVGNNYGDYRRSAIGQSQDRNENKVKQKFNEEQNSARNIIQEIFKKGQTQRSLTRQFEGKINEKHAKVKSQMRPELQQIDLDNYQAYQHQRYEYQRKGSNLTNNEEFSTIKQQKVQEDSHQQPDTITNFHESNNRDGLFTSPELLEECRRLIQISSKFTQSKNKMSKPAIQSQNNKNKLKQSSNIFQKIDYPQYSSPQFAKQQIKFKDMKQMLKHIFAKDWTVYISPLDHQQLLDRCPPQFQSSLSLILTQTQAPGNFLNFLQVFTILKTHLKIKFIFSNIFLLLDVDSKGFVEHSDYEMFMQNFIGSPVEPSVLSQLENKLERFETAVEQTFRGRSIVPGCFEYLELIEKKQIFELGELLQMFQFQIELSGNNQAIHDICQ